MDTEIYFPSHSTEMLQPRIVIRFNPIPSKASGSNVPLYAPVPTHPVTPESILNPEEGVDPWQEHLLTNPVAHSQPMAEDHLYNPNSIKVLEGNQDVDFVFEEEKIKIAANDVKAIADNDEELIKDLVQFSKSILKDLPDLIKKEPEYDDIPSTFVYYLRPVVKALFQRVLLELEIWESIKPEAFRQSLQDEQVSTEVHQGHILKKDYAEILCKEIPKPIKPRVVLPKDFDGNESYDLNKTIVIRNDISDTVLHAHAQQQSIEYWDEISSEVFLCPTTDEINPFLIVRRVFRPFRHLSETSVMNNLYFYLAYQYNGNGSLERVLLDESGKIGGISLRRKYLNKAYESLVELNFNDRKFP